MVAQEELRFPQILVRMLTKEQIDAYHKDGYIIIEKFWSSNVVSGLRKSIDDLINAEGENLTKLTSVFTTSEQTRKVDDYMLSSGRKVHFFWEEKAYKDGVLTMPPPLAINKVGHGLHDLVPSFEEVSYDKRIGQVSRELGIEKPLAVQSMYVDSILFDYACYSTLLAYLL